MTKNTQKLTIGKKDIGDIIDALMLVKNINTSELIKRSGMSASRINSMLNKDTEYYERGNSENIRISTIRNLAKALDVPPKLLADAPYIYFY